MIGIELRVRGDVQQSSLADGGNSRQSVNGDRFQGFAVDAKQAPGPLRDQHVTARQKRQRPGVIETANQGMDAKALALTFEDLAVGSTRVESNCHYG